MVNLSEEASASVVALEQAGEKVPSVWRGGKGPNLWRTFETDKQVDQQSGVSRDRCNMTCLLNEATEPPMPSAVLDRAPSAGAPAG